MRDFGRWVLNAGVLTFVVFGGCAVQAKDYIKNTRAQERGYSEAVITGWRQNGLARGANGHGR